MPELPEVETVRRGLEPIVGCAVSGCQVRRRDVVRDRTHDTPNPRRGPIAPENLGTGRRVHALERRGKQMAIALTDASGDEHFIVVQLGMSGQVSLIDTPRIASAKHVHVVWALDDGRRVCFRDPRRFGGITLLPDRASLGSFWSSLGPDALRIGAGALRDRLARTKRAVKAALLDQSVLAGVGNIYADEALHRAGIDPRTPADALEASRVRDLARCTRSVLNDAVRARGSTLRDYRDANDKAGQAQLLHRVYGRAGLPCPACSTPIASAQIAQRTTCWCPRCQG